jgi:hypothetical protein
MGTRAVRHASRGVRALHCGGVEAIVSVPDRSVGA